MNEVYQYPNNHVIAARITAENPDEGFKPTSGRIERVKFQSTPRVWGYFSVGPFYLMSGVMMKICTDVDNVIVTFLLLNLP
jgi:biotin carboxylase